MYLTIFFVDACLQKQFSANSIIYRAGSTSDNHMLVQWKSHRSIVYE